MSLSTGEEMTATTNARRAVWAQPGAKAPVAAARATPPQAGAGSERLAQPATPVAGSIEDLGRQLLAETNAARCVAYRRSQTGQLIWQHELEADEAGRATAGTLAEEARAAGRALVQVTRPVRDAFGQIIGVIQTRESSDPTI